VLCVDLAWSGDLSHRPAQGLGETIVRAAAGLLLIAVTLWAPLTARADPTVVAPHEGSALFKAAFAAKAKPIVVRTPGAAAIVPRNDFSAAATGAVFALPSAPDSARLLAPDLPVPGEGLAVWRSSEMTLAPSGDGAVDSVRMSLGSIAYAPGGVVLARPDSVIGTDTQAFDMKYTRGWPAALKLSAGGYDLDFSPHASLGVSSGGQSAEAGGMVRFGSGLQDKVMSGLNGLGMHTVSSAALRDRGRWYLFAAASGRAVGWNMGRDAQGNLRRIGWSAEGASELISDAQAGVAWRKGSTEASFGYVHRDIQGDFNGVPGNPGRMHDSMVAFSFSIRPH
jgi:hypothetical protein